MIPAGGTGQRDVKLSGGTLNTRSYHFIASNGGDAEWTTATHIVTF